MGIFGKLLCFCKFFVLIGLVIFLFNPVFSKPAEMYVVFGDYSKWNCAPPQVSLHHAKSDLSNEKSGRFEFWANAPTNSPTATMTFDCKDTKFTITAYRKYQVSMLYSDIAIKHDGPAISEKMAFDTMRIYPVAIDLTKGHFYYDYKKRFKCAVYNKSTKNPDASCTVVASTTDPGLYTFHYSGADYKTDHINITIDGSDMYFKGDNIPLPSFIWPNSDDTKISAFDSTHRTGTVTFTKNATFFNGVDVDVYYTCNIVDKNGGIIRECGTAYTDNSFSFEDQLPKGQHYVQVEAHIAERDVVISSPLLAIPNLLKWKSKDETKIKSYDTSTGQGAVSFIDDARFITPSSSNDKLTYSCNIVDKNESVISKCSTASADNSFSFQASPFSKEQQFVQVEVHTATPGSKEDVFISSPLLAIGKSIGWVAKLERYDADSGVAVSDINITDAPTKNYDNTTFSCKVIWDEQEQGTCTVIEVSDLTHSIAMARELPAQWGDDAYMVILAKTIKVDVDEMIVVPLVSK